LFFSVYCARCRLSQPINATVVVEELFTLLLHSPGVSNLSVPAVNNTQVPIVYQLDVDNNPVSFKYDCGDRTKQRARLERFS
jgi:hypothetical protein